MLLLGVASMDGESNTDVYCLFVAHSSSAKAHGMDSQSKYDANEVEVQPSFSSGSSVSQHSVRDRQADKIIQSNQFTGYADVGQFVYWVILL
jgi:hypothetical protein